MPEEGGFCSSEDLACVTTTERLILRQTSKGLRSLIPIYFVNLYAAFGPVVTVEVSIADGLGDVVALYAL